MDTPRSHNEKFSDYLDKIGPNLPKIVQKKISYNFCKHIENDLDEIAKTSLKIAKDFIDGKATIEDCIKCQKTLQKKLPKKKFDAHIYSPIIWALEEHSDGYPGYYSAILTGLNILDLEKATNEELLIIAKNTL